MANESIVAVPTNVEDPIVLQRFLRTLVERLDVVLGRRSGDGNSYVSQQELNLQASQLTKTIQETEKALAEASRKLADISAETERTIQEQVDNVKETTVFLSDASAIKGCFAKFTTSVVNPGPTQSYAAQLLSSFNISSVTVTEPTFRLNLQEDKIDNISISDNSIVLVYSGKTLYEAGWLSSDLLEVSLYDHENLPVFPVGATIDVLVLFNKPGSELP